MNSNFTDKNAQRFLNLAFQLANDKKINVADRFWLHGYLDATSPSKGLEPGFPAGPVGDARDRNNLRRTNWFNGRYLTAEALSRQDVYFDHRSRLNAHALMPGIAWGLGVEAKKGLVEFTLRRGLAFDGVGRPILVSQDFSFTLAELIGVSLKTPRRVVGGGREFTPCVCLAPDPGGPSGGSAALPSGPYLLVIEAGELPEGRARVTGDVCGGRRNAACEADVWQGSFGLSLVRFPVDAPLLNEIPDVWALRGTLSAYYFDVFEHPLWKRWDPDFPVDGSFNRDSGPGRHEGMAIPLALVHLGEDGTALYLDSWIPRRLITATPGEDWHRVRFGAPPRAAAWARIHQFQAMLQESLAVRPMASAGPAERNLHGRGFRHIPPIGYLPVHAERAIEREEKPNKDACMEFSFPENTISITNPYSSNGIILTQPDTEPFVVASEGDSSNSQWHVINQGTTLLTLPFDARYATLEVESASGSLVLSFRNESGQEIDIKELNQQAGRQTVYSDVDLIRSVTLIGKGARLYRACFTPALVPAGIEISPVGTRSAMVENVLRQAKAYFAGTNVAAYGVVALHDDDILEDLANVINKDPLQLESRDRQVDRNLLSEAGAIGTASHLNGSNKALLFLAQLGDTLRNNGLNIDALVNRHTEVVKLVVPLQGISRRHPLLGVIRDDASEQAWARGLPDVPDEGAAMLADLPQRRCVDVLPRSHVVYVKQRQVLLDLVFKMVELLQAMVSLLVITREQKGSTIYQRWTIAGSSNRSLSRLNSEYTMTPDVDTEKYKAALQSLCENDQQLIKDVLQYPVVQWLVRQNLYRVAPNLFQANRSQALLEQIERVSRDLPAAIGPLRQRQALALAQVADAWAAEYPDAQVLQLLAALQPAELTLELVQQLGTATRPFVGPRVADGLNLQPPSRFGSRTERVLYAGARQGLEERPISDLVLDLPEGNRLPDTALVASLTVADVLARSPEDAAKVLGGTGNVEAITKAFLRDRQAALEASSFLADGVPAALVAKVEAEVAAGQKPEAVLEQLKQLEEDKPPQDRDNTLLRNLSNAETLLRVSGNRLDVLRPLRRQPGG
jgi:hypothetical protein